MLLKKNNKIIPAENLSSIFDKLKKIDDGLYEIPSYIDPIFKTYYKNIKSEEFENFKKILSSQLHYIQKLTDVNKIKEHFVILKNLENAYFSNDYTTIINYINNHLQLLQELSTKFKNKYNINKLNELMDQIDKNIKISQNNYIPHHFDRFYNFSETYSIIDKIFNNKLHIVFQDSYNIIQQINIVFKELINEFKKNKVEDKKTINNLYDIFYIIKTYKSLLDLNKNNTNENINNQYEDISIYNIENYYMPLFENFDYNINRLNTMYLDSMIANQNNVINFINKFNEKKDRLNPSLESINKINEIESNNKLLLSNLTSKFGSGVTNLKKLLFPLIICIILIIIGIILLIIQEINPIIGSILLPVGILGIVGIFIINKQKT